MPRPLAPFLYRRLSRFVTCELPAEDGSSIRLRTKYDVASFNDVFTHPFYWQLFDLLVSPPEFVVDCGANCGHFTILANRCIQDRFPGSAPQFLLIEPNPFLQPIIAENLRDNGLTERATIHSVLLGNENGHGKLWINPKNYLISQTQKFPGSAPHDVAFRSLQSLTGSRRIDLLKLDIEGGEFELFRTQIDAFRQVQLVMMEAHGNEAACSPLIDALRSVGLSICGHAIHQRDTQLLAFRR